MANKHMQRCSTSAVTRKMQVKTTVSYHYTLTKMAKNKKIIPSVNMDVEQLELSYVVVGVKRVQTFWKTVWEFITKTSIHLHMTQPFHSQEK